MQVWKKYSGKDFFLNILLIRLIFKDSLYLVSLFRFAARSSERKRGWRNFESEVFIISPLIYFSSYECAAEGHPPPGGREERRFEPCSVLHTFWCKN